MAKTSVENLKARFKRGMYPTEGDFANVFDSYVHKDDGIDINDVTAENGSKTLSVLLQEFKEEILQSAKDQETQYDDSELRGRVDTNESNISGHEDRITALENNQYNDSELRGRVETNEGDIQTLKDSMAAAEDNIIGQELRIEALEAKDVPEGLTEFVAKVNSFLEDTDASDAAINKWQEIEAFLSGITDTETLTGLLADLKEEILGEIPEQKEYTAGDGIEISEDGVISLKPDENKLDCVKVIADLDASTAPTGTVAIYTGESNEKYIHGFVYEKGEGGDLVDLEIPANSVSYYFRTQTPNREHIKRLSGTNVEMGGHTVWKFVNLTHKTVFYGFMEGDNWINVVNPSNPSAVIEKDSCTNTGVNPSPYTEQVYEGAWTPLNVMNVIS